MIEDRTIYPSDQHTTYQFDAPFFGAPERTFETHEPRRKSDYKDDPVDVEEFFTWFPQFENQEKYPIKTIIANYKRARLYVTQYAQCDQLDGADRIYARGLMCAHLIVLAQKAESLANAGVPGSAGGGVMTPGQLGSVGVITNASVGGVSVGAQIPQSANAWEFWLNLTPYGLELQAFLSSKAPVGIYSNGDDLRSCLRD